MEKQLSEMTLDELWELFPILLTEHKAQWTEWYAEEAILLMQILPANWIARISHIGSTAVGNICAKPIIDILVEITKETKISEIKQLLIHTGYILMAESSDRASLNKGYTLQGYADKVFHLHVRNKGDNDELYFRDYLNDHLRIAKKYEQLKLTLLKLYRHNRDAYTNHKTDFITFYTQKAKDIYFGRYR